MHKLLEAHFQSRILEHCKEVIKSQILLWNTGRHCHILPLFCVCACLRVQLFFFFSVTADILARQRKSQDHHLMHNLFRNSSTFPYTSTAELTPAHHEQMGKHHSVVITCYIQYSTSLLSAWSRKSSVEISFVCARAILICAAAYSPSTCTKWYYWVFSVLLRYR